MSRFPTPPTELNNILRRCLEDIEEQQKIRNENKNTEPYEMLLIDTLTPEEINKDTFSEKNNKMFEDFKIYFIKEKILKFPTLAEYMKKYNFNWEHDRVMELARTGRHETVEFIKFFPVKVLNFNKLQEFRKKYGRIPRTKVEEKKKQEITTYSTITNLLKKGDKQKHKFNTSKNFKQDTQRIKIFEILWKKRRHIIEGRPKQSRVGKPISFDDFMVQAELTTRAGVDSKTIKKHQERVYDFIIKNLQIKKKFPFELKTELHETLLTVKDD